MGDTLDLERRPPRMTEPVYGWTNEHEREKFANDQNMTVCRDRRGVLQVEAGRYAGVRVAVVPCSEDQVAVVLSKEDARYWWELYAGASPTTPYRLAIACRNALSEPTP